MEINSNIQWKTCDAVMGHTNTTPQFTMDFPMKSLRIYIR